jgi:hypothetical protein
MRGSTLMIIVSLQSTVLLAAEDPPPELVRLTGGDTLGIKACKAPGVGKVKAPVYIEFMYNI